MTNKKRQIEKAKTQLVQAEEELRLAMNHLEYAEEMPDNCKCDLRDWGGHVGVVCDEFVADPYDHLFCANCEHLKECHSD